MKYGYIRVSTKSQATDGNSIEAQKEALEAAGADEIVIDTYTGFKMQRPSFAELLSKVNVGDTIIVTKIDRFARTISQSTDIIEDLINDGVNVYILNIGLLDNSPTSVLIRNVMLAFAQFEREMIIERTKEGRAIARTLPGYKEGRPKKFSEDQVEVALDLLTKYSYRKVSAVTGISVSTLVRIKREKQTKEDSLK